MKKINKEIGSGSQMRDELTTHAIAAYRLHLKLCKQEQEAMPFRDCCIQFKTKI
jgi:hypothetical protein